MGCDIHAYIEYKPHDYPDTPWQFFAAPCLLRDYKMFTRMAGVRGEQSLAVALPRGLPEDASYYVLTENRIGLDADSNLDRVRSWGVKIYVDKEGTPYAADHPDWHSHSWLTLEEFKDAIEKAYAAVCEELEQAKAKAKHLSDSPLTTAEIEYYKLPERQCYARNYRATAAAMQSLKDSGCDVRLVFWFDN